MNISKQISLAVPVVLVGVVIGIWIRGERDDRPPSRPAPAKVQKEAASVVQNPPPPEEPSQGEISPIARELGASPGDIKRDVALLSQVFDAWRTNFPREGNPVGDNAEITAALLGANRLKYRFLDPGNPAVGADGQLRDRWGTPFRFHAWSGSQMEVRSAGPDKRFGTSDDVVQGGPDESGLGVKD